MRLRGVELSARNLVLVLFGASMIGLLSDFTEEIFAVIAAGPA